MLPAPAEVLICSDRPPNGVIVLSSDPSVCMKKRVSSLPGALAWDTGGSASKNPTVSQHHTVHRCPAAAVCNVTVTLAGPQGRAAGTGHGPPATALRRSWLCCSSDC